MVVIDVPPAIDYSGAQPLAKTMRLLLVQEIIQESNSLGNEDDKEELELDIDLLDPVTLWKLHRYANSCMKPARKAARGSAGPQMLHSEFSDAGSFGHKAGSNSGAQPESSSCSGSSTSSG